MRAYFSIATGNYLPLFEQLKNSLRKFDKDTDLILFGEKDVAQANDPHLLYRAGPYFAQKLFEQGYTEVCKIDADSLILGNIDHIWEGDFDVAVVNNSNPKEMNTYPVAVWDIHPLAYVNAGFVVMKSKEFIKHWLTLCYSPHFESYQMREQDLLNILVFYNNVTLGGQYKVKFLDDSDKCHGLISRQYEPQTILKDNKIILPKDDGDKQLVAFQYAGGHQSKLKGKYQLLFPEEVTKYIDGLVKP